MTHIDAARKGLWEARRLVRTIMSLSQIPCGHPTEKDVELLFSEIDRKIAGIRDLAGGEIHETGPLIFPIPDVDPRDYPTSLGGVAREDLEDWIPEHDLREKLASGLVLATDSETIATDVLTLSQYKEALRQARPFDRTNELCLRN